MGSFESLPPGPDLFESIRAVGYSLDTAIADLIDNSIAATATRVKVGYLPLEAPIVYIQDNGNGMTRDGLRIAMTLAGTPPRILREKTDLGRFGLGLKTASLSQCRRLIVITRMLEQETIGAVWDLDVVAERRDWDLEWLDEDEINEQLSKAEVTLHDKGTVVIWENLDQLLVSEIDNEGALAERMKNAAEHISLVFHRYLAGPKNSKVQIYFNEIALEAIDPFYSNNPATTHQVHKVQVDGEEITVKAYVIPNISKLSDAEIAQSKKLNSRFRESQGFYIYREKRLLTYGTWFRITPRTEAAKLARVMVDTPNSLDKQWRLGVTKSSVEPPAKLRRAMVNIVPGIFNESGKVITKKSSVQKPVGGETFWRFGAVTSEVFRLSINLENSMIQALDQTLSDSQRGLLAQIFSELEDNFPTQEFYGRVSGDQAHHKPKMKTEEALEKAKLRFRILRPSGSSFDSTWSTLLLLEPFGSDSLLKDLLIAHKSAFEAIEEKEFKNESSS